MRLFKKISFVLMALVVFLPAVSVILPTIVGLEGDLIEMGSISIGGGHGEFTMICEPDTWADYLVAPLFGEGTASGVAGAFIGVLATLQSVGVPLSVPVVFAVGLSLATIVVELIDLIASLFMWIPRQVKYMFEKG